MAEQRGGSPTAGYRIVKQLTISTARLRKTCGAAPSRYGATRAELETCEPSAGTTFRVGDSSDGEAR